MSWQEKSVADLPQYPDDGGSSGEERETRPSTSRRVYIWWALGIAVVALVLVLHMAGVFGPGSH